MGSGNKYPQNSNAEIDLHGQTIVEAMVVMQDFLDASEEKGFRSVRIITGKGLHSEDPTKTIRRAAREWLFANGYEFRYAKQSQGGAGVLVVILF